MLESHNKQYRINSLAPVISSQTIVSKLERANVRSFEHHLRQRATLAKESLLLEVPRSGGLGGLGFGFGLA